MTRRVKAAAVQPPLPLGELIQTGPPGADAIEMDVLFVGGGPAGLAGAIELAKLARADREAGNTTADLNIGVLEKASALGEHILSGAVINPRPFHDLFPDVAEKDLPFRRRVERDAVHFLTRTGAIRVPAPPSMHNKGLYVASLCEVVRWMGERAEALGVNIFAGFPAGSLLVDGSAVRGVRTVASGLNRDGSHLSNYMPPTDITARVTALAEGTRGTLTQAYLQWQRIKSANPQIFALGVKEVWETKHPLDRVIHTMGWPLPSDAFGGSFLYPLEPNVLALGIVVGLDYRDATTDVHVLLQRLKGHPFFCKYLEGGEMVEWGAKTIPEGGYYALAERRSGDGVVILGDAAGFVDVPSLKGVHYAVQSGILAARAIFAALKAGEPTAARLAEYDRAVNSSYIVHDLHRTRNMRLAFKHGFVGGAVRAGLMTMTGGRFPGGRIDMEPDADVERTVGTNEPFVPDGKLTFSKVDAVFKSGNATRDTVPSHLIQPEQVSAELGRLYSHMCPAGVYEWMDGGLRVNAPNCVDCKATDVLGPRWGPREGGSGPRYKRM